MAAGEWASTEMQRNRPSVPLSPQGVSGCSERGKAALIPVFGGDGRVSPSFQGFLSPQRRSLGRRALGIAPANIASRSLTFLFTNLPWYLWFRWMSSAAPSCCPFTQVPTYLLPVSA